MVLNERVAAVQKLKHMEKAKTSDLINLLAAHYSRVFWSNLPEQSELNNCEFTTLKLLQ